MLYKGNTLIPQLVVETPGSGGGDPNENLIKQISGTATGTLDLSNETFTRLNNSSFYASTWDKIILPDTITAAGANLFSYSLISEVNWPAQLTDVSSISATFNQCTNLLEMTIPTTTYRSTNYTFKTSIFSSMFSGCVSIKKIDIGTYATGTHPENIVFSIDIFGSYTVLSNLETIILRRTDLAWDFYTNSTAANYLATVFPSTVTIYVPSSLVSSYQSHAAWGQFSIRAIS